MSERRSGNACVRAPRYCIAQSKPINGIPDRTSLKVMFDRLWQVSKLNQLKCVRDFDQKDLIRAFTIARYGKKWVVRLEGMGGIWTMRKWLLRIASHSYYCYCCWHIACSALSVCFFFGIRSHFRSTLFAIVMAIWSSNAIAMRRTAYTNYCQRDNESPINC